jgi:hypothetical protein
MSRRSLIIFAMTILSLVAIAYIALVDWRNIPEVAEPPAPIAGIATDPESMDRAMNETGGVTSPDRAEALPEVAQPVTATAPSADAGQSPLSGWSVAVALAEEQAARTSIPVHKDFERFVNEERVDHWAENAESLILDGINFSAFGSAYSDWAVECKTAMCLTVASIDAETYYTQQFLPQGGWMDAMLTIRNEIAPVLSFSNNGVSGMHPDPETGRIWMLELWWLQEPEETP